MADVGEISTAIEEAIEEAKLKGITKAYDVGLIVQVRLDDAGYRIVRKSRCACEHARCHPHGDCDTTKGIRLYIVFGLAQRLCNECRSKTVNFTRE